MSKTRFPNAVGMQVAQQLCVALTPACIRIVVAGSLRRRKPDIGDVEILYIPKMERRPDPDSMFDMKEFNLADEAIARLEEHGALERRKNALGSTMFGPKNKLMLHVRTGLPVDLFSATEENWSNYLVCRTGPAESNTRICMAAQAKGWKWNPYGPGFTEGNTIIPVTNEQEVFELVGLPYEKPQDRR